MSYTFVLTHSVSVCASRMFGDMELIECRPSLLEVTFDEFRRFVVLLPEKQLRSDSILLSWSESADWMEGIEYRCLRSHVSLPEAVP